MKGLSPRIRGKPLRPKALPAKERSIPAHTGQTSLEWMLGVCMTVYPRAYGANSEKRAVAAVSWGLSPRIRGKLPRNPLPTRWRRSIPAHTGQTVSIISSIPWFRVYPRAYGANYLGSRSRPGGRGLSPRIRGKHLAHPFEHVLERSIPAHTGQTTWVRMIGHRAQVYPRAYGANPATARRTVTLRGLSPRIRGKPMSGTAPHSRLRSIPAHTGQTWGLPCSGITAWVYPRAYGANNGLRRVRHNMQGLSPRIRGKRGRSGRHGDRAWSIPAHTGQTPLAPLPGEKR